MLFRSAIAGIDQALWDIKGKFFNAPVNQLMGGACRDNMRVYSWIGRDRPNDVGVAAQERKNAGSTAIKMNASEELQMIDTYDKTGAGHVAAAPPPQGLHPGKARQLQRLPGITGVSAFEGGYASIGKSQLVGVTDNMLVTAATGTYDLELDAGTMWRRRPPLR